MKITFTKLFNNNLISIVFVIFSVSLLSYILYRSEFVFQGRYRSNYIEFIFISIIFLLFSIYSFFLSDGTRSNIFILFISVYISLILVELILVKFLSDKDEYKISKVRYYESKIVSDPDYRIFLPPKHFININYNFENLNFFPLSLNRNKKIIVCNENDYWLVQNTDWNGFINKNKDWEKKIDIVFLGDSYAQGQCVRKSENLKYLLEKENFSVLNLAIGGAGPLTVNAIYREYAPKDNEIVIWFFYEGNDLIDLNKEKKNYFLKKYLDDDKFKYNLITKNTQINNFLENFHKESILKVQKDQSNWSENIFKLSKLRNKLKKFLNYQKYFEYDQSYNVDLTNFFKIFKITYNDLKNYDQKLYFIYLPEYKRYLETEDSNDMDKFKVQIENFIKKNYPDVYYVDVHKEIFSDIEDYSKLFSKPWGHYSAEGYKLISELIVGKIR